MFYCNARIYGADFKFHMGAFEVKDGVFGRCCRKPSLPKQLTSGGQR